MRLRALDDFDFAGEDEATGDDVDFREEQIAWDEPEVRFWDVLAGATARDLPSDLAAGYCTDQYATDSPGSSGAFINSSVDEDRLAELAAELEARGYTVLADPRWPRR